MNIAFDIDGVLTDIEKFQLEYGSKFFKKKYNKEISDINGYGIKEVFNCSNEEEIKFWIKNTFKYMKIVKPRINSSTVIKKLREDGNKIFIISSRAMTSENNFLGLIMRKLVNRWLIKNNIVYDDIIFCSVENSSNDKYKACEKYKIDIMVEDKKENIDVISSKISTLCFSTRNNQNYFGKNVYRVNNMDEVYMKINEIKKRSHFHLLTSFERNNLDNEEMIKYYQNLREYYLTLPYDNSLAEKNKKNCLKTMKVLQPLFNKIYNPINLNSKTLIDYHGAIFAANHLHAFDPLMLLSSGIFDFRLLAKEELKNQKIGKLFEYIGSIFVDNNDCFSREVSKNEIIKTLLHGNNVMMFPEGTRNKTEDVLLPFRYGTVSIAQITGAPIIPCALNKNYKFNSKSLFVNIGEKMYVNPGDSLEESNEKLKNQILKLLMEIKEEEDFVKTKVK